MFCLGPKTHNLNHRLHLSCYHYFSNKTLFSWWLWPKKIITGWFWHLLCLSSYFSSKLCNYRLSCGIWASMHGWESKFWSRARAVLEPAGCVVNSKLFSIQKFMVACAWPYGRIWFLWTGWKIVKDYEKFRRSLWLYSCCSQIWVGKES